MGRHLTRADIGRHVTRAEGREPVQLPALRIRIRHDVIGEAQCGDEQLILESRRPSVALFRG
jgi:hypothetical protein